MPLKLTACFPLLLTVILILTCALNDTFVSLNEAEQIVIKVICNLSTSGKKIYKLPDVLQAGDIVKAADSTKYRVERECWFFYLDDIPEAKFAHPVRYVFVYCDNGGFEIIKESWWPHLLDSMVEIASGVTYKQEK